MSRLRVAAVEAAYEIIDRRAAHPELSMEDAISQLRGGPAAAAHLDYKGGSELIEICGADLFASPRGPATVREIVTSVVALEKPIWRLAGARGRDWCRRAMDDDTAQCLDRAGLWDAHPDDAIARWWYQLAGEARYERDLQNTASGREGEQLTLAFERDRLVRLGLTDLIPVWRSLDDNSLGFDVESWDRRTDSAIVAIKIEAKAFHGSSPRFFLTRKEWNTGVAYGLAYRLDLWGLETRSLRSFTVAELRTFVPDDKPGAAWQQLLVSL